LVTRRRSAAALRWWEARMDGFDTAAMVRLSPRRRQQERGMTLCALASPAPPCRERNRRAVVQFWHGPPVAARISHPPGIRPFHPPRGSR
ncbi:MAG: hypothetical protein AB7K35_05810, partial [Pseudorhodoplanes sp.]